MVNCKFGCFLQPEYVKKYTKKWAFSIHFLV